MLKSAFVIAGTHSGCGKTTVSLGLMAAFLKRGLAVQPFKVGPDFIDPGHHLLVTRRSSHNLDGWMMARGRNRQIFDRYTVDAHVAVVEGVMGLFDGFSGEAEAGSSAQMARWLDLPVVLVVDAASMARSAAAVALGFRRFDPRLRLAGVILNRVAGSGHAEILQDAFKCVPEVPVLGLLPRKNNLAIPSRHLGLITAEDMAAKAPRAGELARWIEEGLDLDGILQRTRRPETPEEPATHPGNTAPPARVVQKNPVRIAVARDQAFCFYYRENLRLLEAAGAEIVPFSPLADSALPSGTRGVLLGGGYPELHAGTLSGNRQLALEIRRVGLAGMPIYAECGGFMFLMDEIEDLHGRRYPMTGLFPFRCRMEKRFKALGYREVTTGQDSILGPAGTVVRGHEFHYSAISGGTAGGVRALYSVADRTGKTGARKGFQLKHVLGSYVHLHWGSNPQVARHFVAYCRAHG